MFVFTFIWNWEGSKKDFNVSSSALMYKTFCGVTGLVTFGTIELSSNCPKNKISLKYTKYFYLFKCYVLFHNYALPL